MNFMIKLPVDLSGVPPYIIKVRKISELHVTINDVHVFIKGCSLFLLLASFVVLLCIRIVLEKIWLVCL